MADEDRFLRAIENIDRHLVAIMRVLWFGCVLVVVLLIETAVVGA